MRKLLLSIAILLSSMAISAQADLGRQLWRNFNLGWDVYRTQDYRWRNIFVGTGYYNYFDAVPKAYIYSGVNINWSKYTLYSNGRYALGGNNARLRTTSFSVPLYAGYQVFKGAGFGLNLYTGPTFEMIFGSRLDGRAYDNINRLQVGWTTGSIFRFLYLFRARVAYSYYPMSLLSDFNMPRSAFTVSIGL